MHGATGLDNRRKAMGILVMFEPTTRREYKLSLLALCPVASQVYINSSPYKAGCWRLWP